MAQILTKKPHAVGKEPDYEGLLPEEEAAIEEGRRAYARGEWVDFSKIKDGNGVESPRNKTGAKKS